MEQYVDDRVSRRKFEREIAEIHDGAADYRARGWYLIEAAFPRAVVIMAAPQLSPPALVTGVTFDYSNYDADPPSVRLVHPVTLVPYFAKELPTRLDRDVITSQPVVFQVPPGMPYPKMLQPYMQYYSPDDIPFLCLAGVREYHAHPAHSGDAWELHRASGAGRMVRILNVIGRYGVEPITQYAQQVVPRVIGFQSEAPS